MSIKSLVTEQIRIEKASWKLRERKDKLQDKLNKMDRGVDIIDGVVWKIEWAYGGNKQLTRVGELNEKT